MCYSRHFSDLFCKLSMEKLQFDVIMPIVLYVPYSTHLCRKIQARSKKSSKKCKDQLTIASSTRQSEKMAESPRIANSQLASCESEASKLATTSPKRENSKKSQDSTFSACQHQVHNKINSPQRVQSTERKNSREP
jgi:hypothetical protein